MKVRETALPGVLVVEPRVFSDLRGRFLETWQHERYQSAVTPAAFVQDSVSISRRGTIRGLHYQHPHAQGKLISVMYGAVFDVALDVRRGSPTWGRWVAEELRAESGRQLWVPPGFAHGLQALEDGTVILYKCTDIYHPECDRTVSFDDADLAIPWPIADPIVSARDAAGLPLNMLPDDSRPTYP